jgi:hypothetical protein
MLARRPETHVHRHVLASDFLVLATLASPAECLPILVAMPGAMPALMPVVMLAVIPAVMPAAVPTFVPHS